MGYGDELLAAGQAQRHFEETGVRSVIVDRRGRMRWHPIWEGNPVIVRPEDVGSSDEIIHRLVNGSGCRPYITYPFTEDTGWRFNRAFRARDHVARIYLTPEELALGAYTRARYGPYVLIEPCSKHRNLRWPRASWTRLIAALGRSIPVVQHTHGETDFFVPGAVPVAASFRGACGLVASSAIYIRGESGMLHAAAALRKPTIALWGGCMDWDVLGGYPGQIGLGVTPPFCGSWRPCTHCAAIMAGIAVDTVAATILSVLDGAARPAAIGRSNPLDIRHDFPS